MTTSARLGEEHSNVALRTLLLLLIGFAFATSNATAAQSAALSDDVIARIDSFVESERGRSRIPGIALAIVHDGHIAHVRGYGSRGDGKPVTATTPFPIGSLTKSFTALLIRQLVDAGRIDVDAPLQRYLPWFRVADPAASARITVRHLLNQTSGLSREAGMQALLHGSEASIEQLARGVAALQLSAVPGTRYQYSNLNFVLLGALAETLLQQPWSVAVRERVLQPLAMRDTYTDLESARGNGMSALHRYWFGLPIKHALGFTPGLAPTGALAASAEDMAKYLVMLQREGQGSEGRVVSAQAVRAMLTPASPPAQSELLSATFNFRYGEGWFAGPFGAVDYARWHLGNLTSFAAWMVLLPGTRQGVIVLINANCELPFFQASSTFSRIPIGVVNLLAGKEPPAGPSVADAYFKLNTIALLLGAVLCMVAWWIARRGHRWLVAASASLALAFAALVAVTALGWRGFAQFAPDLALWFAAMLLVLLAPALYRLMRARAHVRRLGCSS